ncbi:MAG: aminodeoxychorismate/anthranilate synthase component II [Eubacteriales bacterium]
MVLLIDNYDSFSYNLYQLIGSFRSDIRVIRNDELTVNEIEECKPEMIFLSPGPGKPADAGVCIEVIQMLGNKIPIFGVCLGHQAICEAYGGEVSYADKLMHGKTSIAQLHTDAVIFKNMEKEIQVARYHSLAAVAEKLPDCLQVIAEIKEEKDNQSLENQEEKLQNIKAGKGDIMAVAHKEYPVYGVQFHPESILTPEGGKIIENFLKNIKSAM